VGRIQKWRWARGSRP